MSDYKVIDFWREKGNLSKTLILIELGKGNSKLVDIGKVLGITTQAVSFYVKELQKNGFVDSNLNITKSGREFIQRFLASLSYFVSKSYYESGLVLSCEAIAKEEIKEGDKVYLLMENGDLYATKKKVTGSSGIARDDALPGEAIKVENLEGIVDIEYGRFYMLEVDVRYCRSKENVVKVSKFISENNIESIFTFGTAAKIFVKKLKKNFCDFAPVESSFEASARGFNTLLIYSPEVVRFLYLKIAENINKYGLNPITVQL